MAKAMHCMAETLEDRPSKENASLLADFCIQIP